MDLRSRDVKGFVKSNLPIWAYKIARQIWRSIYKGPSSEKIFRRQSKWLYRIERSLLRRHHIQVVRSLELRGISDDVINETNKDIMDFTWEHYGRPVFDVVRIPSFIESILLANDLDGDIAECGVYQGSSAKIIRHFASSDKTLYLFDTFTGFTAEDRQIEMGMGEDPGFRHTNTSLELAKNTVFSDIKGKNVKFDEDSVVFITGPIKDTLHSVKDIKFSLVHLDVDLYEPTKLALEFFIPRIVTRGILLLHDYAVDEFGALGVYRAVLDSDLTSMAGPLPFGDTSTALFIKIT